MPHPKQTQAPQNYWSNPASWVALATLIAVLAYTGIQMWQTVLIRQNNVVSQRAFVFAELGQFFPGFDASDLTTKIVVFVTRLTNSGNTATKNLTFAVACRRSPDNLREPWGLLYQEPLEYTPTVLGPKGASTVQCKFTLADLIQIQKGKLFGYIIGDITYRDRLDETILHRTEFELKLSSVDVRFKSEDKTGDVLTPDITVSLSNVGLHNCADEECPPDYSIPKEIRTPAR